MNNKIMRRKQHLKEKKTSTAEHQKPTEKKWQKEQQKKAQQIEKSRPSREMLVKLIFFNSKRATTTRTTQRKQCNLSFSRKFKTQSTKRKKTKAKLASEQAAGRNVKWGRGKALVAQKKN